MSFGIRTNSKGIDAGFEALVLSETIQGKLMEQSIANGSLFGGTARDIQFANAYSSNDAPIIAMKAAPSDGDGLMGALGFSGNAGVLNGMHLMPWSPYPLQGAKDAFKATGQYDGTYNPPVDFAIASRLAEGEPSGYGMAIRDRNGRVVFSSNEKNYLKVVKTTVLDPLEDFTWGSNPTIALRANIDAVDGYNNYFVIDTRPFQKHTGGWWNWYTYRAYEYYFGEWQEVWREEYVHVASNDIISSVGLNTAETTRDSVQLHYCGAGMRWYWDGVASDFSGTPEFGEDFLWGGGESEERADDYTTKITVKEVTFDSN